MESLALSNEEDKMQWILTTNTTFSVKSCYASLNDGGLRSQFRNSIWKSLVPLKIKNFAWLVTHDKILSRDNLARKGWIGPLYCLFCGHDWKPQHIFSFIVRCLWQFGIFSFMIPLVMS